LEVVGRHRGRRSLGRRRLIVHGSGCGRRVCCGRRLARHGRHGRHERHLGLRWPTRRRGRRRRCQRRVGGAVDGREQGSHAQLLRQLCLIINKQGSLLVRAAQLARDANLLERRCPHGRVQEPDADIAKGILAAHVHDDHGGQADEPGDDSRGQLRVQQERGCGQVVHRCLAHAVCGDGFGRSEPVDVVGRLVGRVPQPAHPAVQSSECSNGKERGYGFGHEVEEQQARVGRRQRGLEPRGRKRRPGNDGVGVDGGVGGDERDGHRPEDGVCSECFGAALLCWCTPYLDLATQGSDREDRHTRSASTSCGVHNGRHHVHPTRLHGISGHEPVGHSDIAAGGRSKGKARHTGEHHEASGKVRRHMQGTEDREEEPQSDAGKEEGDGKGCADGAAEVHAGLGHDGQDGRQQLPCGLL
ncbi:hypothetical protein BC831DRAFT_472183, partial [Entophlyctis helioformis]